MEMEEQVPEAEDTEAEPKLLSHVVNKKCVVNRKCVVDRKRVVDTRLVVNRKNAEALYKYTEATWIMQILQQTTASNDANIVIDDGTHMRLVAFYLTLYFC